MAATTESFPQLPLFDLRLQPQDLQAVAETLRSGLADAWDPATGRLRGGVAAHLGARHAVAVSSCTAASSTSPTWPPESVQGDEVIVPSFTFVATAAAALYCGAAPVFAEIA